MAQSGSNPVKPASRSPYWNGLLTPSRECEACVGGGKFCPWSLNAILLVGIFQADNNFTFARRAHFASLELWTADLHMF